MRFDGFDSWLEWYSISLKNEAITPITSFTGILNGASNSVFALYRLIRIVLMVGAWVLKSSLGVQLSKETLDGAAETIMEFLAKSFEGIVMTLSAVMIFLALFILRDWILTNMPAANNIVDEVEEQIAHGLPNQQVQQVQQVQQQQQQQPPPLPPPPVQHQQQQHNDQGQEPMPNRIQIQARPIAAENPQNRPMFELPEFELPLLDDLPPGERPIHPQRHQQRSPEHTGANTPASDTSDGSSWTSASSISEDDNDSQSSPMHREASIAAQIQNDALANANIGIGTNSGRWSTPSTPNSRGAWTYAEEVIADDGSGDSVADEARASARLGAASEGIPSSPAKIRDDAASLAANTQGSTDSDGASWSFVHGESSQKNDVFPLPTDTNKHGLQSPHVDESLPPTFTSERSRSIVGHIDNAGPAERDAGRTSGDEEDFEDDLPLYARRLEALQQAEWDRNIGIMRPNQMHEPNIERELGRPEHPRHDNLAQPLLQANREDPAPANVNPDDEGQANNDNEPVNNAEDNIGDFEAADGILEAMGFRGPLFNAIQYFVLVLLMVGLVLAFSTWLPFIFAQAFVLLNPIRIVLYVIHVFSKAVDIVGELSLDIALILVWRPLRPSLVFVVNFLGPFIAYSLLPLVPGIKDALSMSDESFWNKLTSPEGATPTSNMRDISTVFALQAWEENLWQKLIGWGLPIDRFAMRLRHGVTGESLDDRLLMISIGHLLGVFSAWAITTYTP
ncbi:hypothetical protein GGI22_005630, partial [Coemansia erecta]